MAYTVTCDVCDKAVTLSEWNEAPGIEMKVPSSLIGDIGDALGTYTFCGWACVMAVASALAPIPYALDEEETDVKEEEPAPAPRHEEIPDTGIYMPQGIRIDGRTPDQLPKARLTRLQP
jgi:hypothetical protein